MDGPTAQNTYSFNMSDSISHCAREVLIYATVESGWFSKETGPVDLAFYTVIREKTYKKYLRINSHCQDAINTNSDNMWFPGASWSHVFLSMCLLSLMGMCGFMLLPLDIGNFSS